MKISLLTQTDGEDVAIIGGRDALYAAHEHLRDQHGGGCIEATAHGLGVWSIEWLNNIGQTSYYRLIKLDRSHFFNAPKLSDLL